jgi:hypothetical protein
MSNILEFWCDIGDFTKLWIFTAENAGRLSKYVPKLIKVSPETKILVYKTA